MADIVFVPDGHVDDDSCPCKPSVMPGPFVQGMPVVYLRGHHPDVEVARG